MPPSAVRTRPIFSLSAPVKAPRHMAEKLALEELLVQSGTDGLDERPRGARARIVDKARHAGLSPCRTDP